MDTGRSVNNIYYHGTSSSLNIKRNILPPLETGILREQWRKKYLNFVFFTRSLKSAIMYANKACDKYGGNPIIYKVKPIGNIYEPNKFTNDLLAEKLKIVGVNN